MCKKNLAKTDIKSAFRLIPIKPEQHNLLGIKWGVSIILTNACLWELARRATSLKSSLLH